MDKQKIESAKIHAESMLERLNRSCTLSEEECNDLIRDIDSIEEYAVSEKTAAEFKNPDGDNMDVLFSSFTLNAKNSGDLLKNMLSIISQGKVPENNLVTELDMSISGLRNKYTKICELAGRMIPAEELPKSGAAASEFVEAVKNSETLILRQQIEKAKACLRSFIAVRAWADTFALELQPYQEQASEDLSDIKGKNVSEVNTEEIDKMTSVPEKFLKALNCEDINSPEALNLLDELPRRVGYGISGKQYYIDDAALKVLEEEDIIEVNPVQQQKTEISGEENETPEYKAEEIPEPEEKPSDCGAREISQTEEMPAPDSNEHQDENEQEDISDSDFVKSLRDNGAFITDEHHYSVEKSNSEDKKITATIFTNEMKKSNVKAEHYIVKMLYDNGAATAELLDEISNISEEDARIGLEYMYRKGYLRLYILDDTLKMYCPSPRLRKALTYKDSSKFIGVKQLKEDSASCPIQEEEALKVSARYVLLRETIKEIKLESENGIKENTVSTAISGDSYFTRIKNRNGNNMCLLTGAFWRDYKNCAVYMKELSRLDNEGINMERAVISGLDIEHSQALADTLMQTYNKLFENSEIILAPLYGDGHFPYMPGKKADNTEKKEQADEAAYIDYGSAVDAQCNKTAEDKWEITETLSKETGPVTASDEKTEIISIEDRPTETVLPVMDEDDSVLKNACRLIIKNRVYAACAYMKACSEDNCEIGPQYERLAYAVNDPMAHCGYFTENIFKLITERGELEDSLTVSAALRTFFSNQRMYDYNIKSLYTGIKDHEVLSRFPALNNVVYTLMNFKNDNNKGMDVYSDYHSKGRIEIEAELDTVSNEARDYYNNIILGEKKERANFKRFVETKKRMLSVKGEIGELIKAVADKNFDMYELVEDFLKSNFFVEESIISLETIDEDMLWQYIEGFWDEAGENMMMIKHHTELKSSLRTNITNVTSKAVQLMVRWYLLVTEINKHSVDAGAENYKKARQPLLDNIDEAAEEIEGAAAEDGISIELKAGYVILLNTLSEIHDCITGVYNEHRRLYFYAPFLLTDDVMLNESFIPDFDTHGTTLENIKIHTRIFEHVEHAEAGCCDYAQCLRQILNDGTDNYGRAALLLELLMLGDTAEDLTSIEETIISSIDYAHENAKILKDNFTGELELAQSYGQIDNSVEDTKEKILQIVQQWYEWAEESYNFGFFKKILDSYLISIKENAKSRGRDLRKQLGNIAEEDIPGISLSEKIRRIEKINEALAEQNYTVAEDRLRRLRYVEDELEETIEEDFLKDFLDNYDEYYGPVSIQSKSLSSLVSKHTRNKEQRGGKRLADNWLPGGGDLGQEGLRNLLSALGFKVDTIVSRARIGRFENYTVKTVKQRGDVNYSHPIAAFGSGASKDGFRVVCLYGNYDADGLIDIMKAIGTVNHTLILLNCALAVSERRRLARKTKNALGDNLIAVVDRTVMMFLIKHYDETKINRMLMSLIVPFGFYQPYVWESANVMPPEIFMGRKHELELIKAPNGANIVYGGRQLGKSALLKKAKEDIDFNENGDRAVYIDIKGKNYMEAALKICHELSDQHILDERFETDDWDELARAIKKRLNSHAADIHYLLLLLDEADAFIDSCSEINFRPFDALKDIQNIGAGRFKFVIAGLRNVVKFKKEAALGNNSVLTHLQAMTVKPFNTSEGRELMEVPLHYMGLRFPKEKESLINLILATTNYFPGLIQMYCAKLLEAMRNKDYAGYNEYDAPVYEISEEHIKKVLADSEFTDQIREKFFITLKLDEDNYYYLIALLMAYLYHSNGYSSGYSANDIKTIGSELGISKISKMDTYKLSVLMDELMELNVLRRTDDDHYLFARFTFFQMLGTSSDLDDKLMQYMGE